jgi:hypothetical protein
MELTYYCEDCGASCCPDCLNEEKFDYFVCTECESKNIEILSDGTKVCKQCESEHIARTTQHLKSCPKCHSHQVINIYEKKEELEQKFLELIKNTRFFVQPLRDINTKLNDLKLNLSKARAPPIRCYHYPQIESELLELFKFSNYVKSNLLEKVNVHFRQLSLNKEYFFDIYRQPNSNIRIIQGILENLQRSYDSIDEYLTSNINTITEKIEEIHKKIRVINKIHDLFASYKKLLSLAEDEKPVFAIKTKLANGLNTQDRFKKNKGTLFITNFDLSFVQKHGLFKKQQRIIFKAPVDDLISIKEKGRIFKKLCLEFAYGKYEFSFPSNVISKVIEYIILARNFDEIAIYDKMSAQNLRYADLDLHDLVSFIEEGINSFFSSKCKINKSISDIPKYRRNLMDDRVGGFQNYSMQENSFQQPSANNSQFQSYDRGFYPQDPFDPYKAQNYEPRENYSAPNDYERFRQNQMRNNIEEKGFLMKHLGRIQKTGNPFQESRVNNEAFNPRPSLQPKANNFNKINTPHLSGLFNMDERADDKIYSPSIDSYEYENDKHQIMLNLKKEQYSLKQTLNKLDNKFDQGIITEVDYFRTYKNLQKEIYLIESKINALNAEIKEEESIKHNINKHKYFT